MEPLSHIANYTVLFIDILGQRERLRALNALPLAEESSEAAAKVIKETGGFVLRLRRAFIDFLERVQNEGTFAATLPDEQRSALRELRRMRVQQLGFSDTVVISTCLMRDDVQLEPVNGVYAMLLATCSLWTLALYMTHPLRGGIDIGVGTDLGENEVYGPVLESAYELEKTVAQYPRVVIGQQLLRYVRDVARQTPINLRAKAAAAVARECEALVYQDTDGHAALDPLGEAFRTSVAGNTLPPDMLHEVLTFSRSERERFAADTKLFDRYSRLVQYLERRLPLWGVRTT